MNITRILIFLSVSLASFSLEAEIYSWTDEQGNRIYSDKNPGSSQAATTVQENNSVNYYQPDAALTKSKTSAENTPAVILDSAQASSKENISEEVTMTEGDCEKTYGLPCDRIVNWKDYALSACNNDDRCDDEDFLERKYKPLPIAEIQKRANNAGARRNAQEKKLVKYLKLKYTDQCEDQVTAYCDRMADSRSCKNTMMQTCEDDRSLEQMLALYDNLSPTQKKRVLAMADEMSPSIDWQQATRILSDIIQLIALGI